MNNFNVKNFREMPRKVVISLVRANYTQMKNDADTALWTSGCDIWGWTWLNSIRSVEAECGSHPHLSYMVACYHAIEKRNRRDAYLKRVAHREQQEYWFSTGRRENYFSKHRYGGDHTWFVRAMERRTNMICRQSDDESDDSAIECTEELEIKSPVRNSRCPYCHRRSCDDEFCGVVYGPCEERNVPEAPVRSVWLLAKLRKIIAYLVSLRTRKVVKCSPVAEMRQLTSMGKYLPQMDAVHGQELSTELSSNVILASNNEAVPAIASSSVPLQWTHLCSSERSQKMQYLTDRFTFYKSFEWNSGHVQASEIKDLRLRLPVQFIDSVKDQGTMPIFLGFNVFRYCRTDIEIEFQINSNKFQNGQLLFTWQYLEEYDKTSLDNMFSRIQLPHVILNAGSSNTARLILPFKYINPYLDTKQRKGGLKRLYMGTLRCHVLSKLETGPSSSKRCNISVFIRFPNCEFSGMIDGHLTEPQMMPAITAMVAARAISSVIGDSNCDNKTSNAVPQYLVPTASHSWSLGTGLVEPLHNLRLSASCFGVGRVGIDNSETVVSVPCRTFGMLDHIVWDCNDQAQNIVGHCLWSCDAHPQLEKELFYIIDSPGANLDVHVMPPLGVVASLYQYWRGSIEFRFDIVCTMFHTARLLAAYIPGAYGSMEVTLEQARNSPHVEFDIENSGSFTFIVPFISNKPWWWRKFSGPQRRADERSPSRIYLFVLNPLIKIESISNLVRIIPYVRGGEDFEVAVPVQPAVGLGYNTSNVFPAIDCAIALDGYWPYYISYSGDFWRGAYYNMQSSALSAARIRAPYKLGPTEIAIYALQDISKAISFVVNDAKTKTQISIRCIYMVLINDGVGSNFGIPFGEQDEELAFKVALYIKNGDVANAQKYCYKYVSKSPQSFEDNPCWDPRIRSTRRLAISESIEDISLSDVVEPEMDDERYAIVNPMRPTGVLPSTGFGMFTFNENFSDMKDLMRRYQLYGTKIVTAKGINSLTGDAICRFPVVPGGLDLDVNNENPIWNSMRDGALPIIVSSYIYFRGSIRFKVVLSSINGPVEPMSIWVQHHPDMPADGYSFKYGPDITNKDRFKNHNYAYYIQTVKINNIVEFEVPFYQPGAYGVCRRVNQSDYPTEIMDYVGLGDIVIGLSNADKLQSLQLDVYYSIGDDFSVSTFRGFDPLVYCNEVFPEMENEFSPEMMSGISSFFTGVAGGIVGRHANVKLQEIKDAARTEIRSEVSSAIKPMVNQALTDATAIKEDMMSKVTDWTKNQMLISAFSQLTHCLINPSIKTLAVSVASILAQFVMAGFSMLTSIQEALQALFAKYWYKLSGEKSTTDEFTPEVDDEDFPQEMKACVSVLFTCICAAVGVTRPSSGFTSGYFSLMRSVNSTAMLSNNIMTFLKNSSEAIVIMFKYAVSLLNPKASLAAKLDGCLPDIKAWFLECEYLCDPRVREKYVYDRKLCTRVYDAVNFGALLIVNNVGNKLDGGKVLNDTYKKVIDIRNDMIGRGVHPDVRFEPYTIWITGTPGVGKSFGVPALCNELLHEIEHKCTTSMIFNVTPGLKYWTGCHNPAAIVSDDIFQVTKFREEELRNYFAICSSCILNPPMAAIPDKELRINPKLYIMLCNAAFPDFSVDVISPEAVYRRRRTMIDIDFTEYIHLKYRDLQSAEFIESADRENNKHLRYRVHKNPRFVDVSANAYGPWMSYRELMVELKKRFVQYNAIETANFRDRMRYMYSLTEDFDTDNLITTIPKLSQCVSLKEQNEAFKEHIAEALAMFDDPTRQPGFCERSGNYIRKFKEWVWDSPSDYQYEMGGVENEEQIEEIERPCSSELTTYQCSVLFLDEELQQRIDKMERTQLDQLLSMGLSERIVDQRKNLLALHGTVAFAKKYAFAKEDIITAFACLGGIDGDMMRKLCSYMDNCKLSDLMDTFYTMLRCPMFQETASKKNMIQYKTFMSHRRFTAFYYLLGLGVKYEFPMDPTEIGEDHPLYCSEKPMVNNTATLCHFLRFYLYAKMNARRVDLAGKLEDSGIMATWKLWGNEVNIIAHKISECVLGKAVPSVAERNLLLYEIGFPWKIACQCTKYMYASLNDMSKLRFCKYSCHFIYTDYYGQQRSFAHTGCGKHCCLNNSVFRSCFSYIYDQYNETNKMCGSYYKGKCGKIDIDQRLTAWGDMLKCWWSCHISPFLNSVLDFLITTLPGILITAGILITTFGIKYAAGKVASVFSGNEEIPKLVPQAHNYFRIDAVAKPKINIPKLAPKSFAPQSDQSVRSILHRKLAENTVILSARWPSGQSFGYRQCTCIMITGRKMLVLRHYFEEYTALINAGLDVQFKLSFSNGRSGRSEAFINADELMLQVHWASVMGDGKLHSNYGIVTLPKQFRQFPSIVKYFATFKMHQSVSSVVDMYIFGGSVAMDLPVALANNVTIVATVNSSEIMMDKCYTYQKQQKGLCGSLIVSNNLGNGNGAIIGVHVAGNDCNGRGMAEPIYREMFDDVLEQLPEIEIVEMPLESVEKADFTLDNGNFYMFGTVPNSFAHKESGKSKIVPSLLHGTFPVLTSVNPLRPNDKRQPPGSHPLRDGCMKHGSGFVKPYARRLLDEVEKDISDMLYQVVRPVRLTIGPLTLQQAICGDIDLPYFESLNWKSSEGFPFQSSRPTGATDKRWLFNMEETERGYVLHDIDDKLAAMLKLRDDSFKKNEKPPTIYIDCLKDTRILTSKCSIPGKTRIFSVAPIQCSIDIRKYLTDFTAGFKQNRIKNSCAIGINPDSMEWTILVHYLHEVGTKIITLDYSNYGPTLMSQLVASSINCIVAWFERNGATLEHVKRVRWLLECDILHPVHLSGNLVNETLDGIASGSPLTGECNSIPNIYYIKLSYLEIMLEKFPEMATMADFNNHVRLVVYGDDLIMSVSDNIVEWFNALSIREALFKHNIVVTSAQKGEELMPYGSIFDATFLKRGFKPHPTRTGVWLAPVDIISVQECVNWMHDSPHEKESTMANVIGSLDLAFGHGPEFYAAHEKKLMAATKSIGCVLNTKNWYQRDEKIFGESNNESENIWTNTSHLTQTYSLGWMFNPIEG